MGDPSPRSPAAARFADRIKWVTLARVVALTLLLGFGVAMDLGFGPQPIARLPEVVLYKLVTTYFVLSFVALLATYLVGMSKGRKLAWASLCIDVTLAAALVTITHGTQSVFLFTVPLTVLAGAALLDRAGAFVAATAGAVVVMLLVLIEVGVLDVDLEVVTVAWLRALGPRTTPATFEVIFQGLVQIAALYATAMLSSQLVVELSRAKERAARERQELTALRVRYQDVWSSLPDGLATIGQRGVFQTANPAFLQILGLPSEAVIGQPMAEVLPELADQALATSTTVEITRAALGPVQEIERRRAVTTTSPAVDGERSRKQILAMRSELLRDAGSPDRLTGETLLVVRDVTAAREREQAHLNRQRLATVGAMAMAIAHEIRNPLASISGAVQLLEASLDVDEDERALMQIAIRETQQLSEWIGEFLDYAKPGTLQLEPVDFGELVQDKVAALRQDPRLRDGHVALELLPIDGNTRVLGDRKSLSSLVWNLLRNAVDAVAEADERQVRVRVIGAESAVAFVVEDSGSGVPEADRAKLFEPFFTTRAEGTGLGLATVRRVLENQRGRVEVDGSPLGGARFSVTLPRNLRRASDR